MEKRKFRIGELAKNLAVECFVIRFWEKEFNLKPSRSFGGQRFYNQEDLLRFTLIKDLLHEKGYTIAGARKIVGEEKQSKQLLVSKKYAQYENIDYKEELRNKLEDLQRQLQRLSKLLAL